MKRSEMLHNIKEILTQCAETIDGMPVTDLSQKILNKMEQAGMLPPYNPQHLDHGSVMDCEWTPEANNLTDEELAAILEKT